MDTNAESQLVPRDEPIDFTRSLPAVPPGLGEKLAGALRIVASGEIESLCRTSSATGRLRDRLAAAQWLCPRFGCPPDAERILIANSAQSAVLLLCRAFVPQGKRLVAEAVSYGVLGDLAKIARVPVTGLVTDEEGLDPDALHRAAQSGDVGAVYLNPTFHNPTGGVMSLQHRQAIVAIARRHDLQIIEDDPLGLLDASLPPPLAALAPERTWHVVTLTKTIAQGMRIAYLLCPSPKAARAILEPVARLSHWVAAPIMLGTATQLIESGEAAEIRTAIAHENIDRYFIATDILIKCEVSGSSGSPHIWLPMGEDRALSLSAAMERKGVLVRNHQNFRFDDDAPVVPGVRLSLSSVDDRDRLRTGLIRIASDLEA